MTKLIKNEETNIENLIYIIRGKQVMLASDVAKLYNSETKIINQVVKRNLNRFPEDFCFQLSYNEYLEIKKQTNNLSSRSQFVTLNKSNNLRGLNLKYLPYVFTEHGIMMISGLLKNEFAAKINIKIINAFVEMRKYIANNNYDKRISNIETKLIDYDNKFEELFNKFETKSNNHIFFQGQIYDAYSLLIDIFNTSKKDITIIDNYLDKHLLDILSKTNKNILVITNKYNNEDVLKYKQQYNNLKLKYI